MGQGRGITPKTLLKDCTVLLFQSPGVCSHVVTPTFSSHTWRACVSFENICISYSRTIGHTTERMNRGQPGATAGLWGWVWSQRQLQTEQFKENNCAATHCGQGHSNADEVTEPPAPAIRRQPWLFLVLYFFLSSFLTCPLNTVVTELRAIWRVQSRFCILESD